MKFFSKLFSDKESGNSGGDGEPGNGESGEARAVPSPPAPPAVPLVASCDSQPIDVGIAEPKPTITAPAGMPQASRVERAAKPPWTEPRPRVPAPGATTVTMPPPATATKRVDTDRPLFSPPGTPTPKPATTSVSTPARKPPVAATPSPPPRPALATPFAPAPRRRKTRPSLEAPEGTHELDGEIDAAIDGAQQSDEAPAGEGKLQNDAKTEAEVRALFGRIAAQHVAHVRDFVIELGLGSTSKSWLAICRPAVASLRRAADRIRFTALVAATDVFAKALEDAERSASLSVEGPHRDVLLARYADLVGLLPEAFETTSTQSRREPIVVHSLLANVPGLGSLAIHRLYAAGVMSLAALYRARVDELVATTGLDATTCAAIVQEFDRYRRERAEQVPEPDHARERKRLRTILDALGECQSRFCAADAAEDRVSRRESRRQRSVLTRELDLVLAQIGELDLVGEVARTSTERRIHRIDSWLRDPANRTAPIGARA